MTTNNSNATFDSKNKFLTEVRKLGKAVGQGALARPEFFQQTAVAAGENVIMAADAEAVWDAFDLAISKPLDGVGCIGKKEGRSEQARKVRISEVTQVINVSQLPIFADGSQSFADVLQDLRGTVLDMKKAGDYQGNMQDAFIAVTRAQKKNPDAVLSEEEMRAAVSPEKATKERTEATELEKQLKALKVLRDGTEGTETSPPKQPFQSEQLDAAIELIEERLGLLRIAHESKRPIDVIVAMFAKVK
jgi:hypothetical protein